MRRRHQTWVLGNSGPGGLWTLAWRSRRTDERREEKLRRDGLPWEPDEAEDLLSLPLEEIRKTTGERHLTDYRRGRGLSLALDPRRLP